MTLEATPRSLASRLDSPTRSAIWHEPLTKTEPRRRPAPGTARRTGSVVTPERDESRFKSSRTFQQRAPVNRRPRTRRFKIRKILEQVRLRRDGQTLLLVPEKAVEVLAVGPGAAREAGRLLRLLLELTLGVGFEAGNSALVGLLRVVRGC
ncbi:uncharacterized protein A4U43_C07F8240 [Asparagus officinalis]|uniref:Uncharacterized protein n=1 Tax=Asparagus officinalis TaxID=4686 RepID=A0A5P1EC73_ASPOF|nr:uncharacterized protein A4U43_C07F8240 [Asparagus officinalis]